MAYNVKVEAFEGPFDLLFHLIEKNEIDIYDIPINQVTQQYIEYIQQMEEIDLEVTSEFLVMAATLIEIKSKMLLPVQVVEDQQLEFEDIDPRSELVRKLLEYKKFKMVAEEFKEMEEYSKKLFFKLKEEIIFESSDDKGLENVDMDDLLNALNNILTSKNKRHRKRNHIRQMQRETFTIENKIEYILNELKEKSRLSFNKLFASMKDKREIITTFLALLELIKMKKVMVSQNICFSDIIIELRNSTNGTRIEI